MVESRGLHRQALNLHLTWQLICIGFFAAYFHVPHRCPFGFSKILAFSPCVEFRNVFLFLCLYLQAAWKLIVLPESSRILEKMQNDNENEESFSEKASALATVALQLRIPQRETRSVEADSERDAEAIRQKLRARKANAWWNMRVQHVLLLHTY